EMYFGASVLGVTVLGAWLIERYSRVTHGVRVLGHLLVAATVIGLGVDGHALRPHVTTQAEWMLNAALNLGEWLLAALLVVWGVFVVVQTAALVLGLWLGRAAGAGALAAGRDFTHHESRWARAAARGGRLVRAARQMARSRAAMAHEDVRADRAARRHRRRPAVSGIRLPAIRLLGRRGGRVGDVDRRL